MGQGSAGPRSLQLEPLESRLLLDADPFYSAASATEAIDATLRIEDVGGNDRLEGPNANSTWNVTGSDAGNVGGSGGGVSGDIHSNLVGVHSNTVSKDDALAFADTATLNVTAFEATAGNSTDYSADTKVASNAVTGATSAYVTDSTGGRCHTGLQHRRVAVAERAV